ncbi:MAG: hemerythrin domain-containing protein [Pseudomonadota bacterium]
MMARALRAAAPGTAPQDPLKRIDLAHAQKARLCDIVEGIADALPNPSPLTCNRAAQILAEDLPLHHADEDLGLFPLLSRHCLPEDRIEEAIGQLSREHVDDEAALEEVVSLLKELGAGRVPGMGYDAAGFVLRAFFEATRRHLAWEESTIMPLARLRLGPDALECLNGVMEKNRLGLPYDAVTRFGCGDTAGTDTEGDARH